MLDYKEQIQSIHEFLKRSELEQKYPYAYEIYLLNGSDETALTSRTSGTDKFHQDMESATTKAKQSHGALRIDVFGGKSPNARSLNSYLVNVSGLLTPQVQALKKDEIQSIVKEEIQQHQVQGTSGLGEIDTLLGLVSGENGEVKSRLEGLFGVFNALSGNNKEVERITYQKQLDDFKYETRFNNLQEKYEALKEKHTKLKARKEQFEQENKALSDEKQDLEQRLAGYAPSELMKRVAIGAVANLGGRILTNSPKTAALLGLTEQELKGALGFVEEEMPPNKETEPQSEVEISEMAQTPEEKQKAEIIKNLSEALATHDLETNTKIINIVAVCLETPEVMDKVLIYFQKLNGESNEQKEPKTE